MANRKARQQKERELRIYLSQIEKAASKSKIRPCRFPDTERYGKKTKAFLQPIFDVLEKYGSRLRCYEPLSPLLVDLYTHRKLIVRDISDFRPRGKSPRSHFCQLIDHLFVRYSVPAFYYNAWRTPIYWAPRPRDWQRWFIDVAQGMSVWHSSPLAISRRQANLLLKAPGSLHPAEALRWAQCRDMGASSTVFDALRQCRRFAMFETWFPSSERERFFKELLQWFIKNPEVKRQKYYHIFWWAFQRKFDGPDHLRQPNLSMKGRTTESVERDNARLIRQMGYFSALRRENINAVSWQGAPLNNWEICVTDNNAQWRWTFEQIFSFKRLLLEGAAMKHCVGSYRRDCESGTSSIWSIACEGSRVLTMELRGDTIYQLRGKCNRDPINSEIKLVHCFAKQRNLSINLH